MILFAASDLRRLCFGLRRRQEVSRRPRNRGKSQCASRLLPSPPLTALQFGSSVNRCVSSLSSVARGGTCNCEEAQGTRPPYDPCSQVTGEGGGERDPTLVSQAMWAFPREHGATWRAEPITEGGWGGYWRGRLFD